MEQSYYEQLGDQTRARIEQYKRKSQLYTTRRTLAFILIVLAVGAAYDLGTPWFLALALAILVYFFYLIKGHSHLHDQLTYEENKYLVLKNYLARFSGEWTQLPDTGADGLERGFTQDQDLNLLGKASIFQYCSVARTKAGRQRLAQRLSPEPVDKEEFRFRQAETAFFMDHPQESLHLQALSQPIPLNHTMDRLLAYLSDSHKQLPALLAQISIIAPPVAIGIWVLSLFDIVPLQLPMVLFTLQLGAALLLLPKTSVHITPLYRLNKELVHYYQLLAALGDMLPEEAIGHINRDEIKEALQPIRQLGWLCVLAEIRHNFILLFVLNFLCLWDFHIVKLFISWQKAYGTQLDHWLSLWHETETALSLAVIGHTRPHTVMPELLDEQVPHIEAQQLHNMLIPPSDSVANSISLRPSLNIITGSNMSGKTTWLRTLASACILAYAGAPVCAAGFRLSPMAILTSIRVSDDLERGISTFYAELTRLRDMIEKEKSGQPLLVVIDEIFKGTNSADRIICAQTALIRLAGPKVITLVSTHDFELCRLQTDSGLPVHNFHFEEHYINDEIKFDYRMKEGPCQTTNAQFLLKMVGIE